jgi:metal-responsive CopG/Arc/MetJ family transcriptional regulator
LSLGLSKKVYSIILEKQVKEEIDEIAKIKGRSSSNCINQVLKRYIDMYNISSSPNKITNQDLNSKISLFREELNRSVEIEPPDSKILLELSDALDKLILMYYNE